MKKESAGTTNDQPAEDNKNADEPKDGKDANGQDESSKPQQPKGPQEPPSWTPIAAWLTLPTGMAAAAAVGYNTNDGWALATIFGSCAIFFFAIALWAAPSNSKGVVVSLLIGCLAAALLTTGMGLIARLATNVDPEQSAPNNNAWSKPIQQLASSRPSHQSINLSN